MKILAIRGKNLASLSGPFEVDFGKEPLRGSGLFAITGPTGAGKSTLLDALCLALFDATPRLAGRGGPEIGRQEDEERLVANDVRSLMSRGAADATAEVDFVGRDGLAWRATWRVTRARALATGKVQKQNVTLKEIVTGAPAGGTKSETLEAIEEKLGLTFDQFRKSVLLAQGDFADFLKANADERSTLLQRLTGTEVYERISKAAYRRAKEASDRKRDLESAQGGVTLLGAQERALLEVEIVEAELEVKKAASREKMLEELARTAAAAAEAATQALAKARAAADAQEQFAQRERERREAGAKLAGETEKLGRLKEEIEAGRPEVDRARELDAKVRAATEELEAARKRAADAVAKLNEARQRLTKREAVERTLRGSVATLDSWLKEHADSKELATGWEHVDEVLKQLVEVSDQRTLAVKEQTRAETAVLEAAGKAAAAAQADEKARADLETAGEKTKTVEEELEKVPVTALRLRLETLTARERTLEGLGDVAGRIAVAHDNRTHSEAKAAASEASAKAAETERLDSATRLEELDVRLSESRGMLSASEASLSLADRRVELADGSPCPLCGALEHPWAKEGAPGESIVDGQRKRVRELEENQKGELTRHTAAVATNENEARTAESERSRTRELARQEAELAGKWKDGVALLGEASTSAGERLPEDPLNERTRPLLGILAADADQESEDLRSTLKKADELEAGVKTWRQEAERLTGLREKQRREKEQAESLLRTAERLRDERKFRVERDDEVTRRLVAQLQPVLAIRPENEQQLLASPERLRATLKEEAQAYLEKASQVEERRLELTTAERETAEARSAIGPWTDQTESVRNEAAGKETALTVVRSERNGLLGGRSVADVEELDRKRLADQESLHEKARQSDTAAAEALSGAQAAASSAAGHAREAETAAREAGFRFETERTQAGVAEGAGSVETAIGEVQEALKGAGDRAESKRARRTGDEEARKRVAQLQAELEAHVVASDAWLRLNELLGSADGKKFRAFVQGLTLDALIQETNHRLHELARRYRLERVPGADMDLQVVDAVLGDERRSVQSLSGGETFLVSLALALGLSSLATQRTRVETLFVDEGFGTLDADTLDKALSALEALQASGRRVGIISHVAALTERIGTRVLVTPRGAGRSVVSVVGV